MSIFSGRRALVTAAGSGLGRRIAERLAADGARVFAGDVDRDALTTLPTGIESRVCDVADAAQTAQLFDSAREALGGLDILIAAAGTAGPTGPIEKTDPADWKECISVNLIGAYHCLREALGPMKAQGHGTAILFSSTAGLFGYPNRSPYCASKWAIIGLAKTAAAEAGPHGIRVNAVCPGAVEGPRMDRVIEAEARTTGRDAAAIRADYTAETSLGCFVTADDVANTVLFLCSDAAARISGQAISVDGHTRML